MPYAHPELEPSEICPSFGNHPSGSKKKYDPKDPHFNPMHPPADTPPEVLESFFGEESDEAGAKPTK